MVFVTESFPQVSQFQGAVENRGIVDAKPLDVVGQVDRKKMSEWRWREFTTLEKVGIIATIIPLAGYFLSGLFFNPSPGSAKDRFFYQLGKVSYFSLGIVPIFIIVALSLNSIKK